MFRALETRPTLETHHQGAARSISQCRCALGRSAGKKQEFEGKQYVIEELTENRCGPARLPFLALCIAVSMPECPAGCESALQPRFSNSPSRLQLTAGRVRCCASDAAARMSPCLSQLQGD